MEFCPECEAQLIYAEGYIYCPCCDYSLCLCVDCSGLREVEMVENMG